MITGIAFLAVLVTVPLFGGKLSRLSRLRPRRVWALFVSLALQFLVITVFTTQISEEMGKGIHLLSYAFALVFVQANWRMPGMLPLVSGGLMNLAAIVANGGLMPASYDALLRAGKVVSEDEFKNSTTVDDAKLAFLGDVFAIPDGFPFANVYSIGDVVLVIGGGILVHTVCGSRLRRPKDRLVIDVASYPLLEKHLRSLGQIDDIDVPSKVELVAYPQVQVTRSGGAPVLLIGLPLVHLLSIPELRALIVRASIRRKFGASEAFDLDSADECEASSLAAASTNYRYLAFGLIGQALFRHAGDGPDGLLEALAEPVEAGGATLAEHLAAVGCPVPATTAEVVALMRMRPDAPPARDVLSPSTSMNVPSPV